MYNPNVSLPTVTGNVVSYFKLETLDTNKGVEFLIQPSEQSYSFSAEYAKIAVLGREQPFLNYKHSEHIVSIPDVKFWTYGNNKDLTAHLKALSDFTVPNKEFQEPPTCKLTMGTKVYDRVKVSKFSYKVSQTRDGVPVQAEGSLDFLLAPEPPEPTLAPATTKLSEPEKAKALEEIKKLLDTDAAKAKLYSYTKDKSVITLDEDGSVSVDKLVIGKVADILGSATPPALNSPDLKTATKEGAVDKPVIKNAKDSGMGM